MTIPVAVPDAVRCPPRRSRAPAPAASRRLRRLALALSLALPYGAGPLATLPAQAPAASGARPDAAGVLRRRADWRARVAPAGADSGAVVRRVDPGSPAARAGLRQGDRILSLNGTDVRGADGFERAYHALRGGDVVRARVVRDHDDRADTVEVRFALDSVAHERIPGVTTTYGAVRSERGYLLRTVVDRPEGAGARRLAAVLFIPWLSCDPVEKPDPGTDGFAHTLREVARRSGMLLMRVEKPGLGDSEGPDCRQAGLDDERAAHRAALRALRAMPDVDSTRIFLLGGSIGGALAPVLAAAEPAGIAGVIAVGGFARTWYEHMLEIERQRLTLSGSSPADVNAAMRGFARFYTEYLIGGRMPAEVLAAHPELRPLWYDEPGHQYGRPAAYYQAVQRLDVEGAWATLAERGVPALAVWGEYDWIMSRAEAERATEIVNARRSGLAELVVLPRTAHGLMVYTNQADAFSGERPRYDGGAARAIVAWLRRQGEAPAAPAAGARRETP
jgi:pimeloyl-ACP methyl ester carboxylesterase